jgi:hypothetical protein
MSKDIDFDELDKAVSSLMGDVKDKETLHPNQTLDINTTLAPDEDPAYKNLDKTADGIGSEAINRYEQTISIDEDEPEDKVKVGTKEPTIKPVPAPATPPVAAATSKRGGRFMDVVHPSSDMKSAAKSASSDAPHKGITIAVPSESEIAISHGADDNLSLSSDLVESSLDDEKVPSEPVSELKTDPEPLSSPFLVDAKVEKRPLGGEAKPESPEEKPEEPKEEAEELAQKVAEIENAPDPTEDTPDDDKSSVMDLMKEPAQSLTEVTEHLPDEFAEELLAVEKNVDDPISEDESGDSDKKSPKDDPKDDAKEDLKDEKTSDDHHKVISIPKQYQEKPSSSDETSGSIFDTKHYHKPVAHPAEQKSGWLWVIVIVVFIAVGALLGAAAYFFGLI